MPGGKQGGLTLASYLAVSFVEPTRAVKYVMQGESEQRTMVFILNTGEERIVSHLDYNAFFVMRTIDKANKQIKKAFHQIF